MQTQDLEWRTYEYNFQKKSTDWYWAVSILAISIVITAILFDNILFAVFIALSSFTLMLYAKRPPLLIVCRLTNKEVCFGRSVYPYGILESFWVESRDNEPRIIFKSKKAIMPLLVVPIKGIAPEVVQNFLSRHLREEEHAEPLSQKIMEYLGF